MSDRGVQYLVGKPWGSPTGPEKERVNFERSPSKNRGWKKPVFKRCSSRGSVVVEFAFLGARNEAEGRPRALVGLSESPSASNTKLSDALGASTLLPCFFRASQSRGLLPGFRA
jgi:hypothetical protein